MQARNCKRDKQLSCLMSLTSEASRSLSGDRFVRLVQYYDELCGAELLLYTRVGRQKPCKVHNEVLIR
jgi:hypothetical protein